LRLAGATLQGALLALPRAKHGAPMSHERNEPIRLKFVRSTIDPRSILVDEELNPHGFDEIYGWAKRNVNFVVIDADTGEDITRILLAHN
jgi:hypothetical protein